MDFFQLLKLYLLLLYTAQVGKILIVNFKLTFYYCRRENKKLEFVTLNRSSSSESVMMIFSKVGGEEGLDPSLENIIACQGVEMKQMRKSFLAPLPPPPKKIIIMQLESIIFQAFKISNSLSNPSRRYLRDTT